MDLVGGAATAALASRFTHATPRIAIAVEAIAGGRHRVTVTIADCPQAQQAETAQAVEAALGRFPFSHAISFI